MSLPPRSLSASSLQEFEAQVMDDIRIEGYAPLIQPALLEAELPLSARSKKTVVTGRAQTAQILSGVDDRLLVVVGPCSVHDTAAALDYAKRLQALAETLQGDLLIIMRTYFEKPRTTVGWKGLINDPDLDGTFNINKGLRVGRQLLSDITNLGMPTAVELLDTISPQYVGDLISWGAIGARTTESQLHRELASGVSFPVGFKNGTDGRVGIAVDAIQSASHPHSFLGLTKTGQSAITKTKGNEYCHAILRGGTSGPNYEASHVKAAVEALRKGAGRGVAYSKLMVDCSHGNSNKVHTNQISVAANVAEQVASGSQDVFGVMIESFIEEGRQDVGPGMVYGRSITDACISWEQTIPVLQNLAAAVRTRRTTKAPH